MIDIDLSKYDMLLNQSFEKKLGKVAKVVGLTIESIGPSAKLNDLCHIITKETNQVINAEVVGFKDDRVLLMPYDQTEGVGLGSRVENTGAPLKVAVGDELLGKTLDGLGYPIDNTSLTTEGAYSVEAEPPDPLTRKIIDEVLPLGVKAVDGLITVGKGQRIGIFAGSGVGKSTLMGMFARNTKADINVIALIGERGREVREFIERDLGAEGMKRSVVVVATSDKPALIREKGSITGLYTVLVDGDDFNEPITDTARSILDGHIVLDRKIAQKNHYPAIDVLASISRVMSSIASKEHKQWAGKLRNVMATYAEAEDLVNIGAYKPGSNKEIDFALSKIDAVNGFLIQDVYEKVSFEDTIKRLQNIFEENVEEAEI